mmetsp:Transcript_26829/g.48354  ORF Transcript_26829/g.48354 Transcript_26829/m.48354 type:complete len:297 (+) Transcript_26829:759-1649(+)|eukprot:CAMPEP_0204896538 /NCGR_PEP_ID=MMETSP1397-20131031/219_1 /ASSEMBLY_ACC=CAM_ASM_000891 /TAXON_ID=49980 /ORGANISM="Climacostomum Climacostomum virens, Strain Stock W-24" /LENGTH=296 /DNA_ID=CAMNT_0052064161 /DNA_START=759 /DNA_END=1649 /DNA_ORIENTATION=-
MKILLSGATGTLGRAVLDNFVKHNHQIHCIVKSANQGHLLEQAYGPQVTYIELPLTSINASKIVQIAEPHNAYVHIAFTSDADGPEVDSLITRSVLDFGRLAASQIDPFHFIYTGGCMSIGNTPGLVDESFIGDPYPKRGWRALLEGAVVKSNQGAFFTSVIRSAWVYPDSHVNHWLAKCKEDKRIQVYQNLDNYVSFVHVDDLAEMYRLVLEKKATGMFNCTDSHPLKLSKIVDLVEQFTGVTQVDYYQDHESKEAELGFFASGMSMDQQLTTSRAKELGWEVKHKSWEDFQQRF